MMRLTMERERKGWSKQRLAQEARLSPVYVSQAESGRRVFYDSELDRVAAALGWDGKPEALLEDADDA